MAKKEKTMGVDVKAILLKRIDLKGLIVEDVLQGVVKAKLQELVDDSSNTLDNALMAMVYPELEKAAVKFVEEQLQKLLGDEAQPA